MKINKQSGFTLVELSIVIVIIGFLIAGVAAGTNLIKQASLRAVISDMTGYVASYNNFFGRYNKIPGDSDTAYAYWGATCSSAAASCNGNASGVIDRSTSSTATDEVNKAWNHLSNAAMISSTSIQPVSSANTNTALGVNAPVSRIAGAGYIMVGGAAAAPFGLLNNAVFIGKPTASDTLTTGALAAADAFAIDQKADDGGFDTAATPNPIGAATGAWRAVDGTGSAGLCVSTTVTGAYVIANATTACRMGLILNA